MNKRNNFSEQDANVYMFTSRFLFNQVEHESAGSRTLFLTIPVTNMARSEQFKLQVNKKLNKTLIDLGGTTEGYSMIITGDVEGSRSGTIGLRVLQKPECPHYHGMCTFPPEVWKVVDSNFEDFQMIFASHLSKLHEIEFGKQDIRKGCRPKGFYLERYKDKNKPLKYNYSICDGISYVIKADLHASRQGVFACQPSVFPFDISPSDGDVACAERLFHEIMKIDQGVKAARAAERFRHSKHF